MGKFLTCSSVEVNAHTVFQLETQVSEVGLRIPFGLNPVYFLTPNLATSKASSFSEWDFTFLKLDDRSFYYYYFSF